MDARPIPTTRISQLFLVAGLLACLVGLPPLASGVASPVAHAAKRCKKHGRSAVTTSKKKCKKPKLAVPPNQPIATPPAPAPASLSISPTSFNFGTVAPGDSGNQTFTVSNSGGSASGALTSSVGGTNPTNFVISSDTCNGIALTAGSSCTLDVHCHTTDVNGTALGGTLTVAGYPGGYPFASLSCFETT